MSKSQSVRQFLASGREPIREVEIVRRLLNILFAALPFTSAYRRRRQVASSWGALASDARRASR